MLPEQVLLSKTLSMKWRTRDAPERQRDSTLRGPNRYANISIRDADMAQLVEHHLAKVGVAGSNPVVRSMNAERPVSESVAGLFSSKSP